jgi:hypothetical protein
MAAGGDMGASLAPQLLGVISDKFGMTGLALKLSEMCNIAPEQVGMRAGLLAAGLFPVAGVIIILCMNRYFKKHGKIKLV